MKDTMSIGDLAGRTGVSDSTIRYYEREGLLKPEGRTPANYRYYGGAALERLRFIRAAQASGLSLEDIRLLLSLRDGTRSPCREVQAVLEDRLGMVTEQIQHLLHTQEALQAYRQACETTTDSDTCPVLDDLTSPAE